MELKVTGFEGLFDSIGKVKEDLKPIPNTPLHNYLVTVATQIISQLKQSYIDSGGGTNDILLQSIGQAPPNIIETDGDRVKITVSANEYWKYVNDGVNGLRKNVGSPYSFRTPFPNRAMAKSLQRGMSLKGIALPATFKSFESYSYAAAVKLKRDGIEPNHFVDNVLTPEFLQLIEKELAEELGKIVTLDFQR